MKLYRRGYTHVTVDERNILFRICQENDAGIDGRRELMRDE